MFKKITNTFRTLYNWTINWAARPVAAKALFVFSFFESFIFPIPPDVLLIPMVVSRPAKWIKYLLTVLVASILGGVLGYVLGYYFYETIGSAIINFYNAEDLLRNIGNKYNEYAVWTVFAAAFTPIPYKVITLSAGFFKISFITFITFSLLGRGLRFFLISALLRKYGEKIKTLIEKYFNILSLLFVILLIGGFVVLKYIF